MSEIAFLHPIASGALSKGGAVEVSQVTVGSHPDNATATPVMVVSVWQTSSAPPEVQVLIGGREFPTIHEAIEAWKASR